MTNSTGILIGFATLLATTTAFAQPALTASTDAPAADAGESHDPSSYVQLGGALDADHGIVVAATVEGGRRLGTSPLWIHAKLGDGAVAEIEEVTMQSSYLAAQLGVEARGCIEGGALCAFGGVDAAYRQMSYMGSDRDNWNYGGVAVVPRAGLDVGGEHLRFRASIEALRDLSKNPDTVLDGLFTGFGFDAGIAYRF